MIGEWLKSLITPCPKWARKMGYLHEAIGIEARAKRCASAWAPHQEYSRQMILQAANQCSQRRSVLVVGSGACLDLPLTELLGLFERVILVDLVHPKGAIRGNHANLVKVTADITQCGEQVFADKKPPRHLETPDLYHIFPDIDLVVSLNILSQLPVTPIHWLQEEGFKDGESLEEFGRKLIETHLAWLDGFKGVRLLITDRRWEEKDPTGRVLTRTDPLYEIDLPGPDKIWTWQVAPPGELSGPTYRENLVAAYISLGSNYT